MGVNGKIYLYKRSLRTYNCAVDEHLTSPPQSQLLYNHKATSSSKKNNYTPFLPSNQLPGHFVPIFEQKNLPYSSYEENLVKTNGQVRYV